MDKRAERYLRKVIKDAFIMGKNNWSEPDFFEKEIQRLVDEYDRKITYLDLEG